MRMKPQPTLRTHVISAGTARTRFGAIMKRARLENERFVVGRRGDPTVVIMSVKDYIDAFAPSPKWLKDIQAESKRKGLDRLTKREIDEIISKVRDGVRAGQNGNQRAAR